MVLKTEVKKEVKTEPKGNIKTETKKDLKDEKLNPTETTDELTIPIKTP